MCISAELQREEDHYHAWYENQGAAEVKCSDEVARVEEGADRSFLVLFRDMHEDEDEDGKTTDGEVDPEAWEKKIFDQLSPKEKGVAESLYLHQRQVVYSVKEPPMSGPPTNPSCETAGHTTSMLIILIFIYGCYVTYSPSISQSKQAAFEAGRGL